MHLRWSTSSPELQLLRARGLQVGTWLKTPRAWSPKIWSLQICRALEASWLKSWLKMFLQEVRKPFEWDFIAVHSRLVQFELQFGVAHSRLVQFELQFGVAHSRLVQLEFQGRIFKTSSVLQLRNQDCWPICSHFSVQKLKQCALLRSPMVVVNYLGCHGWLWISISVFQTSAEGGFQRPFQTTVYRWCLRNNRWGLRKSS